jgi:PhnB protein
MSNSPEGFNSITPMLAIKNAADAIQWYKDVFGAIEVMRLAEPNGTIAHAEIKLGSSLIMLAEEHPDYNRSPDTLKGTSVIFNFYVPDVDVVFERAVSKGAKVIFPVKDQFYGDRSGRVEDPFGHMWIISTAIKKVSHEEMQKQFDEMMKDTSNQFTPDIYSKADTCANAIETELKRMNRWSDKPLPEDRYENMGAFGSNTMTFEQWIQFILIPRIKDIISTKGEFPSESQLAAYAVRAFDGDYETDRLHELLYELDELANNTTSIPDEQLHHGVVETTSLNDSSIPPVLYTINDLLPQFNGDDLEAQLQTYDTFLNILSPEARMIISKMLKKAADATSNPASKLRIEKASIDVSKGGNAAAPYDHNSAMKKYMEDHKKNYPQ